MALEYDVNAKTDRLMYLLKGIQTFTPESRTQEDIHHREFIQKELKLAYIEGQRYAIRETLDDMKKIWEAGIGTHKSTKS